MATKGRGVSVEDAKGCGMTRATFAIFRSKSLALADTLHLTADELVHASLLLAMSQAEKAGLDRQALHDLLDKEAVVAPEAAA